MSTNFASLRVKDSLLQSKWPQLQEEVTGTFVDKEIFYAFGKET